MDTPLEAPLPLPSPAPRGRFLVRVIHDRNPFFLLSALSMFIGFRIVLAAVNSAPGDLRHLLLLIVTLNVYEALLIALALFLIVKRGLQRDGWILLTIDALFLVDLTNLNAELFSASSRYGSIVSGICFLLAIAKILIIVRTLGLRLSPGTILYIGAQLAFLLGLPGMFKLMTHQGQVTPMQIYSVWWMAGLLIVAGAFVVRRPTRGANLVMASLPWRLYILVPLISLIVHLASENRVYWVHFNAANVTPVLLALVVVLNRSKWAERNPFAVRISIGMVAVSVLVSLVPPETSGQLNSSFLLIGVAPLRLSLLAAALIMAWLAVLHRSGLSLLAAGISASLGCLGIDIPDMSTNTTRGTNWTTELLKHCIPETPLQWGYSVIGVAFLLLGVGAVVSLRKGHMVIPLARHDVD